ncbi:MAG: hypothetical protein WBG70_17835 [Spirulinaceae cyanobacterium]
MRRSAKKTSGLQELASGQNIVYAGIAWAIFSLLFFLLFSTPIPEQDNPFWYLFGTYILECVPFLAAALLCFRNWRSPQIASGRNVWLGIGLAMACYLVGNLLFGWWELHWNLDPDVSPADLFYIAFYLFISWGMILAVLPRRLNLEKWQWLTVGGIAVVGIAFAALVTLAAPAEATEVHGWSGKATTQLVAQAQQPAPSPSVSPPSPATPATPTASPTPVIEEEAESATSAPVWVQSLNDSLEKLSKPVNLFYVVADVFLLIVATTLLLAFWGGRFSQSWRTIAAATLALYIADMWFKYTATLPDYESGSLLEVFYVFSAVLFAIGAALEYDISSRSRRGGRGRRKRG